MEAKGIPTTRWFDGATLDRESVDQPNPIRGMFVMGHGGNTVTRMPEMLKALEKLDLLVVVDAHPTTFAAVRQR
jgi:formate dehydrogenase major subunit